MNRSDQAARAVNLISGTWLLLSAFLWTHSSAQGTNTVIMGLVIAGTAVLSSRIPNARYINTLAAVWLFISAFVLPTLARATMWNNAIVAIVVFAASTVGYAGRKPLRPARV